MLPRITSEPIIFLYGTILITNLSVLPQLILQKVCLQRRNGNMTLCDLNGGAGSQLGLTPEIEKVNYAILPYDWVFPAQA